MGTEDPAVKHKLCRHFFFLLRGKYLSISKEGDKLGSESQGGASLQLFSPHIYEGSRRSKVRRIWVTQRDTVS